jgi:hypothetical protein
MLSLQPSDRNDEKKLGRQNGFYTTEYHDNVYMGAGDC